MENYNHKKIEKKWQKEWEKKKIYQAKNNFKKKKFYILDMFPYPSGDGLHVGHPKGYIATDVISRMKRTQGHNVLHPMGFDAFGLPAENYAIKNKINPSMAVARNVARFKKQLEIIGLDYDWSREINTTDPKYYKWTQWIFLQLFKKGLAYESYEPINWCPSCKTGLANEDLDGDKCERCGNKIEKKPMRQWVLRITDYAERLLDDIDKKDKNGNPLIEWPESIKELQKNWIGKSEGSEISFKIKNFDQNIKVFTTRADTLFGATYIVLAPEHNLIQELKTQINNWQEVERYIKEIKNKADIERTALGKEKTGVELKGIKAINPVNGEEVPVWVADYVLGSYGTGAVMAVPAHDERDFEFAVKYRLPIKTVIRNSIKTNFFFVKRSLIHNWKEILSIHNYEWSFREEGDLDVFVPDSEIIDFIPVAQNLLKEGSYYFSVRGNEKIVGYKNKIFNIYLNNNDKLAKEFGKSLSIPDKELLWSTAMTKDGILINSGKFSNLNSEEARKEITKFVGGKIVTKYKLRDWVFSRQRYWGEPIPIIHCDKCGVVAVPEKDLPVKLPKVKNYEPTGTGESPLANISSWINTKCPKCKGRAKRESNTMPNWAGSSWYYLRYMDSKNNRKLVDFKKEKYWSPVDHYVGGAEHATRHLIYARFWHKFLKDIKVVSTDEPFKKLHHVGLIMGEDGRKMSKRWGNVVNPDEIVKLYGADTLRVYEMFMGPFDQSVVWSTKSIIGSRRFLEKVWKIGGIISSQNNKNIHYSIPFENFLHKTIKKVSEDIENMNFNTAISSMMILVNEMEKVGEIREKDFKMFLQILAPFAPHITEELWYILGEKKSIHTSPWPKWDKKKIVEDKVKIVVQVNGKVRAEIMITPDMSEDDVKKIAFSDKNVINWINNQTIKKVIYVPSRIINIVV